MLHRPPAVSPPAAWLRAQEGWDTVPGVAAPSPASPTLSSAVDTDAVQNRKSGLNISAPQCGLPRESTGLMVGLGAGRVGPPPHHLQLWPGRYPPSEGPPSALLPKPAPWNMGHPQTRPVQKWRISGREGLQQGPREAWRWGGTTTLVPRLSRDPDGSKNLFFSFLKLLQSPTLHHTLYRVLAPVRNPATRAHLDQRSFSPSVSLC